MHVIKISTELVIASETEFAVSKSFTSFAQAIKLVRNSFQQIPLNTISSRVRSNLGSVLFERGAHCTRTFQENMTLRQQVPQIHALHPHAHSTGGIC